MVQNEIKEALKKIIIFHFRSLRVRNGCHMTDKAIKNLLNDLADVSDIYQGHPTTVITTKHVYQLTDKQRETLTMRRTTREGRGGWGRLGDVGTMGDGPDGVQQVQGDVDTEEEEDNHNEVSSNILNNSNISKRRKIEKINHNWTEDDLPAG